MKKYCSLPYFLSLLAILFLTGCSYIKDLPKLPSSEDDFNKKPEQILQDYTSLQNSLDYEKRKYLGYGYKELAELWGEPTEVSIDNQKKLVLGTGMTAYATVMSASPVVVAIVLGTLTTVPNEEKRSWVKGNYKIETYVNRKNWLIPEDSIVRWDWSWRENDTDKYSPVIWKGANRLQMNFEFLTASRNLSDWAKNNIDDPKLGSGLAVGLGLRVKYLYERYSMLLQYNYKVDNIANRDDEQLRKANIVDTSILAVVERKLSKVSLFGAGVSYHPTSKITFNYKNDVELDAAMGLVGQYQYGPFGARLEWLKRQGPAYSEQDASNISIYFTHTML